MTLDQMIGSIKGYFYSKWNVRVYTKEVPEQIELPSMYFPVPTIRDRFFSKESFNNTYIMRVKVFSTSSKEAIEKADLIADSIKLNRYSIPLLNADGTTTSNKLFFSNCDSELLEEGIAQVSLTWSEIKDFI